jgi:hypothetical protein
MKVTGQGVATNGDSFATIPFDELVLVVHGVGDPQPGSTVSLLARSTASAARPMVETSEVLWLHEDSDRGRFATAFPVHVRSSQSGSHRTVFAEAYWGDLSQLRQGVLGVARGMLDLVFGLRFVAFVAAAQSGGAARALQWLGMMSSRILHGPLLAVNLMLALVVLAMAGTEFLWPSSCEKAAWSTVLVLAIVMATMIGAATLERLATSRIVERFWFWVLVTAGFLGIVAVLNHLPTLGGNVQKFEDVPTIFRRDDALPFAIESLPLFSSRQQDVLASQGAATGRPEDEVNALAQSGGPMSVPIGVDPSRGLSWYARLLIVVMGLLWLSLMLMILAMGVAWMAARCRPGSNRRGLDVALLLPLVAIGGWGQVLPIMWLMGENGLSRVAKIRQFANLFEEAVPLLGIQCVMCLAMGLVQLVVFIYYAVWRPKLRPGADRSFRHPPRLIVNVWVQMATAVCACAGIVLILTLGWNEIRHVGLKHSWFWDLIREANNYAITLLVPLAGLFLIAFRYLGSALDVVLDVINHFYFKRPSERSAGMRFEDEFEEAEISLDSGRMLFSKRALIHSRLLQIIDHFSKASGARPTLTIVCHSQGTVIAIEVLNSPKLTWMKERFREVNLVTMGSPFSHIYQHYFSHQYPPLDRPYWSPIRQRVDYWYNIFRVDDYVGTAIDFPESLRTSSGFRCFNLPIDRHGHNEYWTDKQVIQLLRRESEFAWVAEKPMVHTARPESPDASSGRRAA